jgi:hypothetical protein
MFTKTSTSTGGELVPAASCAQASAGGGFTRRSMLASLGIGSLGLLAGPSLLSLSGSSAAAQTPPSAPATATAVTAKPGKQGRRPKPRRIRDENGNLVQPGPYYVQASCDLSEEYFLTDDVLIGATDKVVPFLNTHNSTVEAVVLSHDSNGLPVLAHLRSDPAATSGWAFTTIDTPFGGITDLAVSSSSTHDAMLMAVAPKAANNLQPACQLSLLEDGTWTVASDGYVPVLAGPLGVGATAAGDLYWNGWQQAGVGGNDVYTFWKWDGTGANPGVGSGTVVMTLKFKGNTQTSPVAAHLHFDATTNGSPNGFAVVMLNDVNSPKNGYSLWTYPQTGAEFSQPAGALVATDLARLLWSYTAPASTSGKAAMLWQDTVGHIQYYDQGGALTEVGAGLSVGDGQVAVWELDDLYTFTILDDQQTANVVTQIGTPATGFTPSIPLSGGLERIYSLPTDPAQGTLFAVDVDETLSVLTKDPATGWTQTVVHQDGAKLQPVSSWNVTIKMLDTNGCAVANGQLQLDTDRPVGLWQASGSTILIPGAPVTMTADSGGKLTVSIPAAELDTAVLTAQALASGGKPSGNPFTITPDIDVHQFLAGAGSLTDKGKLTGSALTAAQNTSWDEDTHSRVTSGPLMPKLTSAGAEPVAQAINHVATLGLAPKVAGAVQSAQFDMTTTPPTFQTSPDPNGFSSLRGTLGASDWWDSAKNDADSVFHGLRHGVIVFKKMVSSWDSDAEQWVVNLTVDIGNGLDQLMTYVIKDVETAIHAISSFFQALGADLKNAWEWLKHFVLELIQDADVNAKMFQGWFDSLSTAGIQILNNLETRTDTFFQDQEAKVTAQITTWKDDVEETLFGSVASTPAPTNDTGGDDSSSAFTAVEDFFKFMGHSPATWLWNKIMSHIGPMSSDNLHIDMSVFQDSLKDLSDILTTASTTATDLGTTLTDAFKIFTSADGFKQSNVGDLFDDFNNLAHDVLVLLDEVADTVLDLIKDFLTALGDLLTSEFPLPVIGEILELAGVENTPSIARVMSLIVAYPATLLHNLWVGDGPMFDFDDDAQTRPGHGLLGRGAADKNGFGLDLAAGVVQFIWAGVDEIIDIVSIPGQSQVGDTCDKFLSVADFVLPMFMTILQWPTPWKATTTPVPCKNWDFSDANVWGEHNNFIPGIIATTIAPWFCQGLAFAWSCYTDTSVAAFFFSSYITPFLQTLTAGANNILGAWWQYANSNASKTDKANAILDWTIPNLSYIDCPLGIQEFIDMSEGATALAKIVIDTVANYGATAFCFQQAVAAKNG